MDQLSELIKEAKPLYFARKRNRRFAAGTSVLALFALVFSFAFSSPSDSGFIYDVWSEEIFQAENGSIIEDMGLPVDEYGLLMVG